MTAVLGLVPVVFLALGWVRHPVVSIVCGALSVIALAVQLASLRETRHELAKRLHL
jgi:predicted mannosyl-3-phosphoglycerate phosphatase (HAD superfamily)